jgi:UDP-glucose 4-epimerase
MIVGVTGGAGFIGGWVRDQLVRDGYQVVTFDHRGRGDDVMLGDVRDATAVTEFAAHVDGIIHLAAVLGTQETIGNPRPAAETNVLGMVNVLDACHQYRLPLVNICVGNHWMRNTYSTTKHCAERLLEQYRDECGLRAANVRAVNAYGPRQSVPAPFGAGKVRKIIPTFACHALSGLPIPVYGDGTQVSDCVSVRDVARVLVAAIEHCGRGEVPSVPVEVGPVEHATVADIAARVGAEAVEFGGTSEIVFAPMRPGEQVGRPVIADPTTCALVGIDPATFTPLSIGIAETVAWFHREQGVTW